MTGKARKWYDKFLPTYVRLWKKLGFSFFCVHCGHEYPGHHNWCCKGGEG